MNNKEVIRKRILNIRKTISNEEVSEKSKIIIEKLRSSRDYINSKTIFIYMDFNNEVQTFDLIKEMMKEKKRIVIPYTDTINTVIIPVELKDIDNDLKLSSFGYLEPKKEKTIQVKPEEFDLIIVPGVAFDKKLNRIGFGKGYYDRILSKKRNDVKAVAIAFEFQVLDEVPSEEHDVKMDKIITDKNIYC